MLALLTIIGATGLQGGSVVASALKSKQYRIRAITRNVNSAAALKLASQGVEVVAAELDDESSLIKAFEGSTAIFAITNFFGYFPQISAEEAMVIEHQQGINLTNAAMKTPTLKHYIWSTLPNTSKISGGKFKVAHVSSKNRIDDYIKSNKALWEKTTFLWCTFYGQNFAYPLYTPTFLKTAGKYIQLSPVPADTPLETIGDVSKNLGIFATAILAQPEKTWSKIVLGSVESTTHGKFLQTWSDGTGKESLYVHLASVEEYENLFPKWGYAEGAMMMFWEEYPDKSWSDVDGVEVLTRDDLKLDGKEFVGVKETVEGMDWSGL